MELGQTETAVRQRVAPSRVTILNDAAIRFDYLSMRETGTSLNVRRRALYRLDPTISTSVLATVDGSTSIWK